MRVFLTGGTGFIGGNLAAKLRERGDEVVALVRSPDKAAKLRDAGCELVQGDLSDLAAIKRGLEAPTPASMRRRSTRSGIPKKEHPAMYESNVNGTENVLDAAIDAGTDRIVYVSTINVFGNTKEQVVDESYQRDESEGFLSCYDETKYKSHQIAKDRIAKGAPIVIVQPGGVYGPGDHSELGNFIDQTRTGKLRAKAFPQLGFNLVYVDDVVEGILLALDKGKVGESYVLGGQIARMDDLIAKTAELSGKKAPKATLPVALMKVSAPLGPVVGPIMGFPPNFGEAIKASDGVTYWAKHDKAMRELGYSPRDLETGLKQTLDATA